MLLKGGFKVSSDKVSLGLKNGLKVLGKRFLWFCKWGFKVSVTRVFGSKEWFKIPRRKVPLVVKGGLKVSVTRFLWI